MNVQVIASDGEFSALSNVFYINLIEFGVIVPPVDLPPLTDITDPPADDPDDPATPPDDPDDPATPPDDPDDPATPPDDPDDPITPFVVPGNDTIHGNGGNDHIFGGGGNDIIRGG